MPEDHATACDDSLLCRELAGQVEGIAFHEIYRGHPPTRILHRTANFAVLCDLAPLVEGHLLIVPLDHLLRFGQVREEEWPELLDLAAICERNLTAAYAPPIVLEHGSSSDMTMSACVSHAHLHFVPVDLDLRDTFERDKLVGVPLGAPSELRERGATDRAYLYFRQTSTEVMRLYQTGLSKRRQYIRTIIAERIGIPDPDWDWGHTQRIDLLRSGFQRLSTMSWV